MRALIVKFGRATTKADIALFFYAGHGIQAGGENYLVPIEAEIEFEDEIGLTLIPAGQVLAQLGRAKSSRLVFLDACRDNPFKRQLMRSMGVRSVTALSSGLSQPTAIPDTFIAYATQPDSVANDGTGRNSPFTAALLGNMEKPGQTIHDLMLAVGREVRTATKGEQEPWSASSLREHFIFAPEERLASAGQSDDVMVQFGLALDEGTPDAWQSFVRRFNDDPAAKTYLRLARSQMEAGGGLLHARSAMGGVGGAELYEEGANAATMHGTVRWTATSRSPGDASEPETAIHGDIVIPERNLDLSLIVYRNVDVSLPASHIVELSFRGQEGRDPIERIAGIIIRDASEAAGKPLVGASTKVVDGFFLFALSGASQDVSANVALLDKAAWIDIPVLYRSGRRALISIQKGGGNSVFTAAIADWQT